MEAVSITGKALWCCGEVLKNIAFLMQRHGNHLQYCHNNYCHANFPPFFPSFERSWKIPGQELSHISLLVHFMQLCQVVGVCWCWDSMFSQELGEKAVYLRILEVIWSHVEVMWKSYGPHRFLCELEPWNRGIAKWIASSHHRGLPDMKPEISEPSNLFTYNGHWTYICRSMYI